MKKKGKELLLLTFTWLELHTGAGSKCQEAQEDTNGYNPCLHAPRRKQRDEHLFAIEREWWCLIDKLVSGLNSILYLELLLQVVNLLGMLTQIVVEAPLYNSFLIGHSILSLWFHTTERERERVIKCIYKLNGLRSISIDILNLYWRLLVPMNMWSWLGWSIMFLRASQRNGGVHLAVLPFLKPL